MQASFLVVCDHINVYYLAELIFYIISYICIYYYNVFSFSAVELVDKSLVAWI